MSPARPLGTAQVLLLGTLLVGVLDITDAFVFFGLRSGVSPQRILHSIAAGVLGRDAARAGGWPTAALGLCLHFFIAFGIVTTYYLVSRFWRDLARRPFLYGPLYGLVVYVIMSRVVVPLSAATYNPNPPLPVLVNQLFIHALGVGMPSAWVASRAREPGQT